MSRRLRFPFEHGDAQSWLNLQSAYDLKQAEIMSDNEIKEDVKPYDAG